MVVLARFELSCFFLLGFFVVGSIPAVFLLVFSCLFFALIVFCQLLVKTRQLEPASKTRQDKKKNFPAIRMDRQAIKRIVRNFHNFENRGRFYLKKKRRG